MRKLIIAISVYFFSIFIFQLPVTYVTQDIAAFRALFPVSLFTLAIFSILFYYLGQLSFLSLKMSRTILITALSSIILLNSYTLINQIKTVPIYSKSYDSRMHFLSENRCFEGVLTVCPLPPSGLLHSAEISRDPQYFSNQHLRKGLGIKPKIKVKPKNCNKKISKMMLEKYNV